MDRPDWLDREEYPFSPRFLDVGAGRMHYIDEGEGRPLVMLHGNPSWSFLYRHLIKGLSRKYRCVAPDLMGFGLSDKPRGRSFRPEEHARHVALLVGKLGLDDVTFFVHDWGGPVGLSWAVEHPERTRALVIFNTWMWPLKGDSHYERFSAFMGGPAGRFIISRDATFRLLMGWMFGQTSSQYLGPLADRRDRQACWVFPREIIASTPWLASLWEKRQAIASIPALILWGGRDVAFREKELRRWQDLLEDQRTVVMEDAGHFVQEARGAELCPAVEEFLAGLKA
ncbi:MAG: alpha/beta fold hydrolase [Thermodesulfovibrionales bacterium]